MLQRLVIFVFALTISMFPVVGHAFEVIVPIDHFPPWKDISGDKPSGIDVELTKALLTEIGAKPKFTVCPWSRCLDMVKSGEAHFISGLLKRPERESYLSFIEPPYKTKSSKVFYIPRYAKDIESLDDLKHLTIGTNRGVRYFDDFDQDSSLRKAEVSQDKFNFLKLAEGRLDTVVTTESQGDYLVASLGLGNRITKSTYRFDEVIPVHFAVSKFSLLGSEVEKLNTAAKKLRDNGTFDAIIRNYFENLKNEDQVR